MSIKLYKQLFVDVLKYNPDLIFVFCKYPIIKADDVHVIIGSDIEYLNRFDNDTVFMIITATDPYTIKSGKDIPGDSDTFNKLIAIMEERAKDSAIPPNAVDRGYQLAVAHMKKEIENIRSEERSEK